MDYAHKEEAPENFWINKKIKMQTFLGHSNDSESGLV